ncbi:hypothetical protein GCM10022223_33420 [Kineosporia mesophila]|uniref:Uncharacterized protein n=1 Tax=Kineosporia mesophila TaxID=566012 RepID=A0ABP6ZN10_9ACTN
MGSSPIWKPAWPAAMGPKAVVVDLAAQARCRLGDLHRSGRMAVRDGWEPVGSMLRVKAILPECSGWEIA